MTRGHARYQMAVERSRLQVLVIEDDPDSRGIFGDVFSEAGIDAVCVDPSALPESQGYGVVMTDLPGNGRFSITEAREWVSLLRDRYRAPIVIVTGRHEAAGDELLNRTALIVQKPIDIDALLATISQAAHRAAPAGN